MASAAGNERELLRKFLNKECLWVPSDASTNQMKVYTATTAVSAVYMPRIAGAPRTHMNVTLIVLKPKKKPTYVTVYINGTLAAVARPEVLFTKSVQGPHNLTLMYFGVFSDAEGEAVPVEVRGNPILSSQELTTSHVFATSTAVKTVEELQDLTPSEITPLGRGGAWYAEGALYMFFINMDMLMCCPNMPTFPSLTHFINLLTRCENGDCVTCYGSGGHVNVLSGWTADDSPGTSGICPCLLPCSALNNDYVPVTGHRALLGLMFKPEDAPFVVGLRFSPPKMHPDMSRVLQGVLANGKEVPCTPQPWTLLRFSDFYSRVMLYNCQVLKRQVLHSY
ncbi:BGLF2 [Macacine gammaherpesvirus 4]|uniref:BGLF2 n=1 Tax=Macacine gammaherpesvirus 4 TaxID=45455 RepID=Q8UZF6_9GAMA|nr:BGLF2 [Macacine gammaherpesvirus 4]AAK95455.1 BGLF2 [Macacine gammaherpesvirus 4]